MLYLRNVGCIFLLQCPVFLLLSIVGADECTVEGEIKLVRRGWSGNATTEGIVELCLNGEWGNICNNNWDAADAEVVCRQLNLPTKYAKTIYSSGRGILPIHYTNVLCTGSESRLVDCPVFKSDISYCDDAAVGCPKPECNETDIRLVNDDGYVWRVGLAGHNGSSTPEGRVEICINGEWDTICDRLWDISEAEVVCRQLNLTTEYSVPILRYGGGSGTIYGYNIFCIGNETHLVNCTTGHRYYCDHYMDAGVRCPSEYECNETDIRLIDGQTSDDGSAELCVNGWWGSVCVNGKTSVDGRVEVCLRGQWGTVCHDYWDTRDAIVVCRQLGYDGLSYYRTYGSDDPLNFHLDDVHCNGYESKLSECDHRGVGVHNCAKGKDEAGVICTRRALCNETDIQLLNNQTSDDGRVEVCLYGRWASVCDDYWDTRDATVVCRQLGYDGLSYPLLNYGRDDPLHYHLDGVNCNGNESNLHECNHQGFDFYDCREGFQVAGALCTNKICEHGRVHLVGSDTLSRGRVEYCYEGSWYSICTSDIVGEEVRVVCGTLGYSTAFVSVVSNFGRGMRPILPKSIQCTTNDDTLSDCAITDVEDVNPCPQVAGVICEAFCLTAGYTDCNDCDSDVSACNINSVCNCYSDCYKYGNCCPDVSHMENCVVPECETGEVRLVGGGTNSTGRLEFCANGIWGKVCNRLQYWGPDNTRVVCRQLGFSEDGAYVLDNALVFGWSGQSYVVDKVYCAGTERELLECYHSSLGRHSCEYWWYYDFPDIAISCYDENTSCEDGDVRLQDGTDTSNGRVEICKYRTWSAVCSDKWNENDARVVCRQLSYNPKDARPMEVFGRIPIAFERVNCTGFEAYLNMCSNEVLTGKCSALGVTCQKSSTPHRCADEAGTPPDHASQPTAYDEERFGVCEAYGVDASEAYVCANVLRPGIDFVYISHTRYFQNNITTLLNDNIRNLVATSDTDCVELVFKVICHYYLPPCGNSAHTLPPYSLCQEECEHVQSMCEAAWQAAALAFGHDPFINCADTSLLLFPLPNCCTGAGIALHDLSPTILDSTLSGGTLAGIVIVILAVLVVAVVVVLVMLVIRYRNVHRKRVLERIQLDILARPAQDKHVLNSAENDVYQAATRDGREVEQHIGASVGDPNPYSVQQASGAANSVSGSSLQGYETRTRVPSHYLRELTLGKFIVKQKEITLLDDIGEGEFGIVYKAKLSSHGRHGREVAVKTLKGAFDQFEVERFVEESLKMSRFKHSHVMGLIGVCLDAGSAPFIIMPYMANGSLLKYLKKERKNIVLSDNEDENEVTAVCKRLTVMCSQIASGMEYLAGEKYIHRDLATRNCMIDTHFLIKITDFGLSEDVFVRNYFRQGSAEEVVKLPVKWMAPESLSDGHFSEKTDVWSYGVTMWEIFSGGKAPFPGTDPLTLMQRLEEGERMPKPHNTACSDEMYVMMKSCWEKAPEDRPTFKELYRQIIKYIEHIAGYLEMGFNPFSAESVSKEDGEEREDEKRVGIESGNPAKSSSSINT